MRLLTISSLRFMPPERALTGLDKSEAVRPIMDVRWVT